MDKNLIKIEGIYNNLTSGEKFNIFCTMEINIKRALINIKNCEINQEIDPINNNNLINFDEKNYNLKNDEIINNTLNIINNLKNNEDNLEGYNETYLNYLAQFIFQYIYNEYYLEGNFTFETIKLI